jgi:photosystem II stability/assembly factor-like uncharacterized protein
VVKPIRLAILIALFALAAAPAAEAGVRVGHSGWEWSNPLPQGNTIRALDFAGQRGYAGGSFGTLLRSDDGGRSWTGLAPGITEDVASVEAVSADSVVVAGGCALRRSYDGGGAFRRLPWTEREQPCRAPIAASAFPSSDIGYVLREDGRFYRTSDGGASWSRVTDVPLLLATTGPDDTATGLAFSGPDSGVATSTSGIYRTTDGGASWSKVVRRTGGFTSAAFGDALGGLAVGSAGTVYKTLNGGLTWSATAAAAVAGPISLRQVVCLTARRCLVTSETGDRVLSTTTGGVTWTAETFPQGSALAAGFPSTTSAVVAGAGGAVAVSEDGAVTWTGVGSRLTGEFTRLSGRSGRLAFAFGSRGALARTTDGGQTWTYLAPPTQHDLIDVSFAGAEVGLALDSIGVVYRTADAGVTWLPVEIASSFSPQSVLALDDERVLLAGARGILRSTDGGASFRRVGGRAVRSAVLLGLDRAGGSLFAYGPKNLLGSRDGGIRWQKLGRPDHRPLGMADFVSSRSAFALGKGGRLWRTRNRGRSWRELVGAGTDGSFEIAFSSARNGYAVASDLFFAAGFDRPDYVLRTTDGGATFRPQLVAKTRDVNAILATRDATDFLLAGADQLFSTVTGGNSGRPSSLRLTTSRRRLAGPRQITIAGRLSPALEGQRVVVSTTYANPRQRRGANDWSFKSVRVGSDGTFKVRWTPRRTSVFVAQWTGDGAHRGAGSRPLKVTLPKRRF